MALANEAKKLTYADYLTWGEDERWELIDGMPYAMATPSRKHQEISMQLSYLIRNHLEGHPCKIYAAPFSVRLNADQEDDTVVEPDLVVICDPEKLDDKGCKGAPDFIIEILSPSTAKMDTIKKFNKYLQARVPEYWIVNPETESIQKFIYQQGIYVASVFGEEDTIDVNTLSGLSIPLSKIFES